MASSVWSPRSLWNRFHVAAVGNDEMDSSDVVPLTGGICGGSSSGFWVAYAAAKFVIHSVTAFLCLVRHCTYAVPSVGLEDPYATSITWSTTLLALMISCVRAKRKCADVF